MSAIKTNIPSATTPDLRNGAPVSRVDSIGLWTDEEKGDVLIALLRELIDNYGGGTGLIPIETPTGESLGYYVPPRAAAARAEALLPKLTPEREQELARRANAVGPVMTAQEWISELKTQAAALGTR